VTHQLRDLTRRHDIAVLLAGVSGAGALGLALALAIGAESIGASPTFATAAEFAPITTWAVGFTFAGLVVLSCLARRPDELALALIVLALLTLAWAAFAAASIAGGGLTTGVVAYLVIAAFEGVAALAAVRRAEDRR